MPPLRKQRAVTIAFAVLVGTGRGLGNLARQRAQGTVDIVGAQKQTAGSGEPPTTALPHRTDGWIF